MYKYFFKQIIDFLLSSLGFIIVFPIFILVTICLLFANKGKPFFLQQRPGKNNKIFKIIKFKTMNDNKDNDGNLLPPSKRITFIGNFVRKTSLDEIPQLINVIKGDMSLIGPRPLRIEYLPLYSKTEIRRHEIKPGITGWAQINGRNSISWEQKFEMDIFYVDNMSIYFDVKILLLTIKKIFKRENIYESDKMRVTPFKGANLKE